MSFLLIQLDRQFSPSSSVRNCLSHPNRVMNDHHHSCHDSRLFVKEKNHSGEESTLMDPAKRRRDSSSPRRRRSRSISSSFSRSLSRSNSAKRLERSYPQPERRGRPAPNEHQRRRDIMPPRRFVTSEWMSSSLSYFYRSLSKSRSPPRRRLPQRRSISRSRSPIRERAGYKRDEVPTQRVSLYSEARKRGGIARGSSLIKEMRPNDRPYFAERQQLTTTRPTKFLPPGLLFPRGNAPRRLPNTPLNHRLTKRRVDRSTTCPFLLRIYVHTGDHYTLEDFQQHLRPSTEKLAAPNHGSNISDSEVQVYTWRDASLREIVDLVKDVCEETRQRSVQLSLKLLHFGRLHSSRPGTDDRKTLQSSQFDVGDSISLAILQKRRYNREEPIQSQENLETTKENKEIHQSDEKEETKKEETMDVDDNNDDHNSDNNDDHNSDNNDDHNSDNNDVVITQYEPKNDDKKEEDETMDSKNEN